MPFKETGEVDFDGEGSTTAARLKALRDAGLTHADIVALVKEGGREAVLAMGEEELRRQEESQP